MIVIGLSFSLIIVSMSGFPFYTMNFVKKNTQSRVLRLSIRSIKVTDAKPVEYVGANDLYCQIECGTIRYRTPTLDNTGANGDWDLGHAGDNASGLFREEEAKALKMKFELWDENTTRSNTKIGVSEPIDMSKLVDCINDVRAFSFNVQDSKGKISGKVLVMAVLTPHVSHNSMT